MTFKEKYKRIKNFKKKISSPFSVFYFCVVTWISSTGFYLYNNHNIQENYTYQPVKEYIDIENINIPFQLFYIENNNENIYSSNRIRSIFNNKFKEIEKNILIESTNFKEKNFAANYINYADKDEIKFSSMTQPYSNQTIFSYFHDNSLFFENNSDYIITDKEKNISQSKIKTTQNYYNEFDSLIKMDNHSKNNSEYKVYDRFEDSFFIIEKQKDKFIFTLLNKEKSLIKQIFVIEKSGNIFISKSVDTAGYSKINIQKEVMSIKKHLEEFSFLQISAVSIFLSLLSFGFSIFLTNLYLYLNIIFYINKKNKLTIDKKKIIEKEIKYVE